ncbi:MAG TPA: DMT family transporter [Candidatus Polarisedimenticolia bacterium]|nr:DMT family transporter [Candidatus Polarisedimenticolia bacterium]
MSDVRFDSNDLGLVAVVLIWGFNLPVVKIALRQFEPLSFNAVRFVLAALLLLLLLLRRRDESPRTSVADMLKLLGLGLLGQTAYQILFIEGIARTTASHTALIFGLTPVLVAILSLLLGHEKVGVAAWTGAALAFGGESLIIAGKAPVEGPTPSLRGDLLVLGAAFCWCLYTVLARPLLARHSPLKVTALSVGWGTLAMLPFCLPAVLRQDWKQVTPADWLIAVLSSLLALVLAYLLWYRSVKRVGNVRTAVYSNLVPLSGTFAGWLILKERLSPLLALGAAAIFAGIALTRSRRGDH